MPKSVRFTWACSIKVKLLLWLLFILSITFAATGLFLYYELKKIVIGSIDSHLHSETQFLASLLEVERDELEWELKEASVGEYSIPFSGHYYQIVLGEGEVLVKSPSLADRSLPFSIESPLDIPHYENASGPRGEPLRLMNLPLQLPTGKVTIQAAEGLKDSYDLINSFRNTILMVFPGVFILSVVGGLLITGLSLRPIEVFSRRVGTITERNLNERVDTEGVDKELRQLATSFNRTLERLEDSFLRQRQFFSNASHELRTPVSVIKSQCEVTLKKERSFTEYQEVLKTIHEMVTRMSGLIERILEVSRLDMPGGVLRQENLNLMGILEDVYKLIAPLAEGHQIGISLKGEKGAVILGDRERLIELFTNIVDNAIKYNQPGGRVEMGLETLKGEVVVIIMDTGIGIPKNEVDRIFDRFYRIDTSRGRVAGSGLGLSIVRAIAEAHQGRIEVKSEVGKGSIFKVYLPVYCS